MASRFAKVAQKLYLAYYGRAADAGGQQYWADQLDQTGGSLVGIIDAFANAPEAEALYGSDTTPTERITVLYDNVLGRPPDPGGLDYYTKEVSDGRLSLGNAALAILDGVQGDDVPLAENRLAVAEAFTAQVSTEPKSYEGDAAAAVARTFIKQVTGDAATVTQATEELPAWLNTVGVASKQEEKFTPLIRNGLLTTTAIVSTTLTEDNLDAAIAGLADGSFTVTVTEGVVTFGGSATGTITFSLEGSTATFSRGGVTAQTRVDLDTAQKIVVAPEQDLQATAVQLSGRKVEGAGQVKLVPLDGALVDLSGIVVTGGSLAVVDRSATLDSRTALGTVPVMVLDGQTLTLGLHQANGQLVVGSGTGANDGAVVLTGQAQGFANLMGVQTAIRFADQTLSLAEGSVVLAHATRVAGEPLAILGTPLNMQESLQLEGSAEADTIVLSAWTTGNGAQVNVHGGGGSDTVQLGSAAAEVVSYLQASEGGAGGDLVQNMDAAQDRLLFKWSDFGGANASLWTAGGRSLSKDVPALGAPANLANLGENFSGVVRIQAPVQSDWSDVDRVATSALTGSNDGLRVLLLLGNGSDTRVYHWDDGAGTADSRVGLAELTLVATLSGVQDPLLVNTGVFG